jgi:hypothetical protein
MQIRLLAPDQPFQFGDPLLPAGRLAAGDVAEDGAPDEATSACRLAWGPSSGSIRDPVRAIRCPPFIDICEAPITAELPPASTR